MSIERKRVSDLADMANAVRYAHNADKDQYSEYIGRLIRAAV